MCFSDLLGGRLEAAENAQLRAQACLCYICAGNIEKLVSCWSGVQDGHCPLSLQAGLHTHSSSVSLKLSLKKHLCKFSQLQSKKEISVKVMIWV